MKSGITFLATIGIAFLATISILFAICSATDSKGSFDSKIFMYILGGEIVGGGFVLAVQSISRSRDESLRDK